MCDMCISGALVQNCGTLYLFRSFFIFGRKRVWEWMFIVCFNIPNAHTFVQLILGGIGFGDTHKHSHSQNTENSTEKEHEFYVQRHTLYFYLLLEKSEKSLNHRKNYVS